MDVVRLVVWKEGRREAWTDGTKHEQEGGGGEAEGDVLHVASCQALNYDLSASVLHAYDDVF